MKHQVRVCDKCFDMLLEQRGGVDNTPKNVYVKGSKYGRTVTENEEPYEEEDSEKKPSPDPSPKPEEAFVKPPEKPTRIIPKKPASTGDDDDITEEEQESYRQQLFGVAQALTTAHALTVAHQKDSPSLSKTALPSTFSAASTTPTTVAATQPVSAPKQANPVELQKSPPTTSPSKPMQPNNSPAKVDPQLLRTFSTPTITTATTPPPIPPKPVIPTSRPAVPPPVRPANRPPEKAPTLVRDMSVPEIKTEKADPQKSPNRPALQTSQSLAFLSTEPAMSLVGSAIASATNKPMRKRPDKPLPSVPPVSPGPVKTAPK